MFDFEEAANYVVEGVMKINELIKAHDPIQFPGAEAGGVVVRDADELSIELTGTFNAQAGGRSQKTGHPRIFAKGLYCGVAFSDTSSPDQAIETEA